jgi:hypothetical protein
MLIIFIYLTAVYLLADLLAQATYLSLGLLV